MLIGGLQKTTLLDYPDKIAATVFTIGCNFRCSFCHNPDIVKGICRVLAEDTVLDFFEKRKKFLDAVCVSGGEPTLQTDLVSFIKKLKKQGYLVKLDTNGSKPKVVEKLIKDHLIDYIAMDIKAPWESYNKITIKPIDIDSVKESAIIIKQGKIPYEFRSTVLPVLHSAEDIVAMAEQIKGANKYYLQQFTPAKKLINPALSMEKIYSQRQLNEVISGFKDWFGECKIR